MRELLFRGKDIKGNWHIGLLAHIGNAWYISNSAGVSTAFEVIPETVGQYTGTKLGVEKLFEGDIVECHEDYDDSWGYPQTAVVLAVVVWDEENFCWAFETGCKDRQPFNDWTWDNSFINGNIHDKPRTAERRC